MVNYFDIIIIIPLLWGGFKGFKKGLVVEVASLLALFLGVWGGVKFSSVSASYLGEMFSISENVMPLISFAITFILIVIAVFALAKLLQKVVKMASLSTINKIAGALFGALKFALIISVILSVVNNVNKELHFIEPEMEESSLLYKPISKLAVILIPGIEEINVNGMVENAVREEASNRLEEASKEIAPVE
jgi:membrane protein required for colicin V production